MALSNGVGYSAVNARRGNLASSFTAPGHTYSFSLNHRAGEGFVFTVRDTATNQTTTQAWGVFATSPGGTVAPTLAGLSPLSPFDAIQIQARSTIAGATTTFSNLVFASPALSVSGGNFSGGALHRNTTIGSNPRGTATQELLADVNLSGYSWTLSGTVNFQRAAGANGANNVSLTVNVRNVAGGAAIPVPEPAGALVAAMVLGASLSRRRRTA